MKSPYTFTVIRYIHDVVSGEFVNVGVAVYAPSLAYVAGRCTTKYGRLSQLFLNVDGSQFRGLMNLIESQLSDFRVRLASELRLEGTPNSILDIAWAIVPKDDSSIQFSPMGEGLTEDPAATLEYLYQRYVERYCEKSQTTKKDEAEVWRHYRGPLVAKQVVEHLKPHKIVTRDYEYEFEHAWKNGDWRMMEPVSFDLADPSSIADKATRWLGRTSALEEAKEKFKLYLLLGRPQEEGLLKAFQKAENILHKIKIPHDFVREEEAEDFAESMRREIRKHLNKHRA